MTQFNTKLGTLFLGDSKDILVKLEGNSVDSIVTDPPYGYQFMNKAWDYEVPKVELWKEVLRVLKPGGHMLVACGTRTQHRMVVNIEDAGFEIRDIITWHYGSGFPKSQDISKAIDKQLGKEREVIGTKNGKGGENLNKLSRLGKSDSDEAKGMGAYGFGAKQINIDIPINKPATPESEKYEGFGTALKPACELWTLARKPIEEKTIAKNVLKYGTGGLNIDESRVRLGSIDDPRGNYRSPKKRDNLIFKMKEGGSLDNSWNKGRWPANLILTHHPDCEQKGTKKVKGTNNNLRNRKNEGSNPYHLTDDNFDNRTPQAPSGYGDDNGQETVENWNCHPDCPVEMMDEQSDNPNRNPRTNKNTKGSATDFNTGQNVKFNRSDRGGASRFFYVAKAGNKERYFYCKTCDVVSDDRKSHSEHELVFHPTQKPEKLISYLIKMITPEDGIVLDPFIGSGTLGKVAEEINTKWIGIELDEIHFKITKERIKDNLINNSLEELF